ncbi:MAG: AAA family ATPase [Clostridia bacterium]|nr:AAA family ATPase [Clostridia bacterium]
MLRRKITDELLDWKNRKDRQCLVVKGARQVGKTYIIERFGRDQYECMIRLNFIEDPALCGIFDGALTADQILSRISLFVKDARLIKGSTLIFLDEIQECPNARAALKFLAGDPRFDVIASGSLLGINYKEVPSFPVGFVDHLEMHSLDLEEFLWARGVTEELIAELRGYYDRREPVPDVIHQKMMQLFREYIVIGGMPKVVDDFVTNLDYRRVRRRQQDILADYENDIAKYAEGNEKAKARACFVSIPRHLAKNYKKFQYSLVEARGTSAKFAGSLMWLFDAGIINFCYNLSSPELPFEGNVIEDCFKVYMRDTGLLMAMLEDDYQEEILSGDLGIYKGAIYENVIADLLTKAGRKLYYFEYRSRLEIDFFIRYQKKATAVEVKSADNTKAKSMNSIIENWNVPQGIKLSSRNTGTRENVVCLPIYMVMFL